MAGRWYFRFWSSQRGPLRALHQGCSTSAGLLLPACHAQGNNPAQLISRSHIETDRAVQSLVKAAPGSRRPAQLARAAGPRSLALPAPVRVGCRLLRHLHCEICWNRRRCPKRDCVQLAFVTVQRFVLAQLTATVRDSTTADPLAVKTPIVCKVHFYISLWSSRSPPLSQ